MEINFIAVAKEAIIEESKALLALAELLPIEFNEIINIISLCNGKIVITGVGKSGHIARKIASTFASTGTQSVYVHPAEASHGDLGMIGKEDIVIAISKSGESSELSDVLTYCRRFAIPVIGITAVASSSLGEAASYLLRLPAIPEACPMGLAPTTSTTMTLALGDAMAVACIRAREFIPEDFKIFHPGGKLGQKLAHVKDIMHPQTSLPLLSQESPLSEAILEMSKGRFGCIGIINEMGELVGIFTDGDLRRHFNADNLQKPIHHLMSVNPYKLSPNGLIADVFHLFTEKRIPSAFVCIEDKPVGLVHMHDLFQRGFI